MDGLVMMMMMMMIIVTLRKMISMKVKMLTTFAADRQLLAQVKTIFFYFRRKLEIGTILTSWHYQGMIESHKSIWMLGAISQSF